MLSESDKKIRNNSLYTSRTELPMLLLAMIAIFLYLLDLRGYWANSSYQLTYHYLASFIDLIFVADLMYKIKLQRSIYLRSPWFVIDFISALPILGVYLPVSHCEGLRFVRGFRFFRILRTLRTLRTLKFFEGFNEIKEIEESNKFRWVTLGAVCLYTFIFIIITASIDPTFANLIEFYLVIGSLLGMSLVLIVVSFMLPDISVTHTKRILNLFLPDRLVNELCHNPQAYKKTIRAEATVIFCDIRGFTQTVELLNGDLDTLKSHLEQSLEVVTSVHSHYDLIIDKFIGDAVMSFRGGNLVEGTAAEHAYRVVKASLETEKALAKLGNSYFNQIKIGGASCDRALIGVFGTSTRLTYTILGDRVNLAARLEAAVSQCGTHNLFCERTMELTKNQADFVWRYVGLLNIQGKQEYIKAYEVFDRQSQTNWQWIEQFHKALEAYQNAKLSKALQGFIEVDRNLNGDHLSQHYQDLCHKYLRQNISIDRWTGYFETHK
jgi:class 3 adenylate cyclase